MRSSCVAADSERVTMRSSGEGLEGVGVMCMDGREEDGLSYDGGRFRASSLYDEAASYLVAMLSSIYRTWVAGVQEKLSGVEVI